MFVSLLHRNTDVREARGKIPFWLIAEKLDVHENTLRNWMKKELPPHKKKEILAAVAEIKKELKELEKGNF